MIVLVCFAVKQEAQFFHPASDLPHRVKTCITGIGQANTEKSVREALKDFPVNLVLTCGFAGALDHSLTAGSIVFETDDEWALRTSLISLKASPVRFHCAARIASSAAEKAKLRQQTGADAVEMESAFIRQICRERQIACATVRVILDTAGEDLPLDFNRLMNRRYELNLGKLIGRVVASPDRILPLLALQRQSMAVARKLGSFLQEFLQRQPA